MKVQAFFISDGARSPPPPCASNKGVDGGRRCGLARSSGFCELYDDSCLNVPSYGWTPSAGARPLARHRLRAARRGGLRGRRRRSHPSCPSAPCSAARTARASRRTPSRRGARRAREEGFWRRVGGQPAVEREELSSWLKPSAQTAAALPSPRCRPALRRRFARRAEAECLSAARAGLLRRRSRPRGCCRRRDFLTSLALGGGGRQAAPRPPRQRSSTRSSRRR